MALIRTVSSLGTASGPTDPWAALDGRLGAPNGTPLFPTILNGYPLNASPNMRVRWPTLTGFQPQWMVAGVDYPVGPDSAYGSSIPWKVPGVDSLPSGASLGSNTITVSGNNVVLDGWDLTGGTYQGITVSGNNCTVSNCKIELFVSNSINTINVTGDQNTITKCLINGNGFFTPNTALIQFNRAGGTVTITYCIIEYSGSDGFYPNFSGTPNFTIHWKYNALFDMGCAASHPDFMQEGGSGNHTWDVGFNFFMQRNTTTGSQPWVMDTDNGQELGIQQGNFNNNVILSLNVSSPAFPGSNNLNNILWVSVAEANRGTGMNITQNYFDPTQSSGIWGGGGGTYSGNIRMDTGVISHP